MGRLIQLGALACLYLGAESKALRWQDDTPSWVPPKQTIAAMNMEELGFSPNPTAAPDPANVELKLAKRLPLRGWVLRVHCGNRLQDCHRLSASVVLEDLLQRRYAHAVLTSSSSSAQPECITYVYSGSLFSRYTLFGCAASEQRVVVYANPTDTSVTDEATTSDPVTSTFPTTTSTDTGTLSPASSTAASGGSGGGGGGSSTPVGAIVGGVVGGVAAIALIVFGVIFLLRKKKKDAAANSTNNQPAPVNYNGPPPPQQGQPQMYQQPTAPPTQQPSPGGYGPPPPQGGNFPQGFAPVDNRQSMLKQPYDVTTGSYEQTGVSPPASPPPMSPSPTYQSGIPQYAATQNGVSPTYTPQQQQQQQQQGGYYNAPPPAQAQQGPPQQHYQQPGFSSELPAHRGDSELRELA
ncbi:hypothetical protein ColTof4_10103 [Colletotrichum tofieldiae]|nr:hypothetical protein ColTof4_10103 [Colletotrichum tofieldiae]